MANDEKKTWLIYKINNGSKFETKELKKLEKWNDFKCEDNIIYEINKKKSNIIGKISGIEQEKLGGKESKKIKIFIQKKTEDKVILIDNKDIECKIKKGQILKSKGNKQGYKKIKDEKDIKNFLNKIKSPKNIQLIVTQENLIIDSYKRLEKTFVNNLAENALGSHHNTTKGSYKEKIWSDLFKMIVPEKFNIVNNSFLIDSDGQISKEIDIIIYDSQYTPFIFDYDTVAKIVPIEAALAVVQCKSSSLDNDNLDEWVKSIEKLEANSKNAYAWTYTGVKGNDRKTKPFKILCSLKNKNTEKFDFSIFVENEKIKIKDHVINRKAYNEYYTQIFEIVNTKISSKDIYKDIYRDIEQSEKAEDVYKTIKKYCERCKECGKLLGICSVYDTLKEIGEMKNIPNLIKIKMLLNQYFMLINNPMIFSHYNYAKLFDGKNKDSKNGKK